MGRGENTSTVDLALDAAIGLPRPLPEAIISDDALARLQALAADGRTAREIAAALNEAGLTTSRGLAWQPMHVYKLARTGGVEISGRACVSQAAVDRLCQLYREELSLQEIADTLNQEGLVTATGRPWAVTTVSNALQRAAVKRLRNERSFSDEVIRRVIELRVADYSLDRIARALTEEGFETPLQGRWWPATVKTVIEIALKQPELTETEQAALSRKRTAGIWPKSDPRARVDRETVELIVSLRSQNDERGRPLTFQAIAEKLDDLGVATARAAEGWRASTVRAIWASAAKRLAPIST